MRQFGMVVLAVLLVLGVCVGVSQVADAATYYVNPDGNDSNAGTEQDPWRTISYAVDQATAGDTIKVEAGTDDTDDYVENVTVDKQLHIEGVSSGGKRPQVKGNLGRTAFSVTADKVVIKGLDIYGATESMGMSLECGIYLMKGVKECQILDNRCGWDEGHNNGTGIHLDDSSGNTVSGNTCSSNISWGIFLWSSSGSTVSENTCSSNSGTGIFLSLSSGNTVSGNTCSSNRNYNGITLQGSNSNTVSRNTCSSNRVHGIVLASSSSNTVSGNTCSDNSKGIFMTGASGNTIYLNSFSNNTTNASSLASTNRWWSPTELDYVYDSQKYKSYIGNYYSGYNPAGGSDGGIWKTSYQFNGVGDEYPLVATTGKYKLGKLMTYYVSPTGNDTSGNGSDGNPWRTISHAVDQATAEDTIKVMAGTDDTDDYVENVTVDKQLRIEGVDEGGAKPQVKGNSGRTAFSVTADNVVIKGLDIYGATGPFKSGIYLKGVNGCTIRENRCGWDEGHNNGTGIHLVDSSGNTVSGNTCSDNASGIHLSGSSGNTVSGNSYSRNNLRGIYLESSSGNTVSENICSISAFGIYLSVTSTGNMIYLNSFNNTTNVYSPSSSNQLWSPTELNYVYDSQKYKSYMGNYYSGYSPAGGSDGGIWNTSYQFNGGEDEYPLVAGTGKYKLAEPKTYYVSSDGNDNNAGTEEDPWRTIRHAVDQAFAKDTIKVMAGTDDTDDYVENVVVDKQLQIEGVDEGGAKPQIKAGNPDSPVFKVIADNVVIKGLDIYGATGPFRSGIYLKGVKCQILENRCGWDKDHRNTVGISLDSASVNTISGNTCSYNSATGIWLPASSNDNTISDNICSNNTVFGILLYSSSNNTVSGNSCLSNSTGIVLWSSSSNTVSGNTCNANKKGTGIWIYTSSNDNTVSGNTCENNIWGIRLESSSGNTVSENPCTNNFYYGIALIYSNDNNVLNNPCSGNTWGGITLWSSSGGTVSGNTCENNTLFGIWLHSSGDNTVLENSCSGNSTGIYLSLTSGGNTVSGNTCENNIHFGIFLHSSSGNTIYLNSFSNTTNVSSVNSDNLWSSHTKLSYVYGSTSQTFKSDMGNYYSNYEGSDDNGDGIGIPPYTIDTNTSPIQEDKYPLIKTPNNYDLNVWYLSNSLLVKGEMSMPGGTVSTAASKSKVWVAKNPAPAGGLNFSAGDGWAGLVTFVTAPGGFKVAMGYADDKDGSNFQPGGPEATVPGGGQQTALTYVTNTQAFTVSAGKYLALKITNTDASTYTVRVGGVWSYCASPSD